MTIEEKAKAYDEAMNKIKPLYEQAKKDDNPIWSTYEHLFPQLRESEDDRIRKALVWHLKAGEDFVSNGVTKAECIAYLEKQKEPLPIPDKFSGLKSLMLQYLQSAANRKDDAEIESDTDLWGRKILDYVWKYSDEQKKQKPIKIEAYEVGKGTTICGQDYKCKKDYKEGNCWYIKDVIYHCGRDGYLTDQNGTSWSCTPEWFKEYIQSNAEWAEEEKNRFVSGQFLQCKLSFDGFKEGEHYWLEYVGDDTYVGRSDNILNLKFHITPRQLYTLFSQQLEEKQKEQKPNYCHYGGDPSVERCKYCSAACSARLTEEHKSVEWNKAMINDEPISTENQIVDIPLAEWNHDNRIQYDSVKSGIDGFASTYSFNIESKLFPQLTKEQQQLWREEIEQAVIAGGEDGIELARDNRYKENRMIEWNEEDKSFYNSIMCEVVKEGMHPTPAQANWLKLLPERFNLQPKQEWSEEDKEMFQFAIRCSTLCRQLAINHQMEGLGGETTVKAYENLRNWLSCRFETLCCQPKVEWSEEDEKMLHIIITDINYAQKNFSDSKLVPYDKKVNWLKSLSPQSREEVYQSAKHDLAIKFMNYLDDNRPEGKMSLSNGECEDIDKAFKENDWSKIIRYIEKYQPHWKPSEQKYDGNMDKECIKLCDVLNFIPSINTFESCCGHLNDRYSIWFFCNDIITISRLGRCVERNYSDGKWELLVDSTDTHPTGVFWLRSKVPFQSYDKMEKSVNELCNNIQYWFNTKFDSYFNGNSC